MTRLAAGEERQDGARRHSLVSPTPMTCTGAPLTRPWPAMRDRKVNCFNLTLPTLTLTLHPYP